MKRARKYRLYLGCLVLLLTSRTIPCLSEDSSVTPFSIGEVIRYTIHAGGIRVGIQTIKLACMEVYDGRPVYRISGKMKTTGVLNLLFQISEEWEVLVDSSTLSPVLIERNITDRGERSSYVYRIHQEQGEVIVIDRISGVEKVLRTRNLVFDQFSLCYFYRKNPEYFTGDAVFDFLKKDSLETIVLREEGTAQVHIPKLAGSDKTSSHMLIQDGGEGIEIYTGVDAFSIPLKIVFKVPLSDKKNKTVISLLISGYAAASGVQNVPEQYRPLLNKNLTGDL
jgi:hypothetical protein